MTMTTLVEISLRNFRNFVDDAAAQPLTFEYHYKKLDWSFTISHERPTLSANAADADADLPMSCVLISAEHIEQYIATKFHRIERIELMLRLSKQKVRYVITGNHPHPSVHCQYSPGNVFDYYPASVMCRFPREKILQKVWTEQDDVHDEAVLQIYMSTKYRSEVDCY